jgi:hypothetical protein
MCARSERHRTGRQADGTTRAGKLEREAFEPDITDGR